jgi:hypothetical protein
MIIIYARYPKTNQPHELRTVSKYLCSNAYLGNIL